jgi:arsenite methyltransferase
VSNEPLTSQVREKYAAVARSATSGDQAGVRAVAEAFGYTAEELAAVPADAHMGLSCGNPVATARLRPGETVVDLGCGGGIDVLLAAAKVGPTGRAVGIDMTPDMVDRANRTAAKAGGGTAPANVEFLLGRIERLPLPDGSVDCLISNCVINLAPDKPAVFREMFRVLKPGGRVAVSDIALKRPLPPEVSGDLMAYVGCVAGAIPIADYERELAAAGFTAVQITDTGKDLNVYKQAGAAGCCAPSCCTEGESKGETGAEAGGDAGCCAGGESTEFAGLSDLLSRYDINEYAASVRVYALKGAA